MRNLRRSFLLVVVGLFGICSTQSGIPQAPGLAIFEQPKDVVIVVGTNATFEVKSGGAATSFLFQWFENGRAIPGATQNVYITHTQTIPGRTVYTVAVHAPNPYLGTTWDPYEGVPMLGMLSEPAVLTASPIGGLLAYWSFDENFTTNAIDSAGSYHGRVVNGVRVAGAVGSGALQLNGQDAYMFVGGLGSPLQLTNTPYTLSWWQKWDGPTGSHQDIIAMDDGADYSGGYQVYIERGTHLLGHVHSNPQENLWQNAVPLDSLWRHYAVTFDGTARRLYVDGQLHGSRPTSGPVSSDGNDALVIGAISQGNGNILNFFNGAVDEIRIYSRALGAAEIAELGPQPEILITRQPVGVRVGPGEPVRLSVEASTRATTAPLEYQWEVNRAPIPGATNLFLNVTGTNGTSNYRVSLRAGNLQRYSDEVAVVTVTPPAARLLLHLEFEGTTNGIFADSAGNFGGIEGNVQLAPGRVGNFAANIASNALIRVPAAGTDLELVGTTYTIAWWMRPVVTSGPAEIFTMGDPVGGATGYGARMDGPSSFRSLRTEHRNRQAPVLSGVLRTTNWVHLALVYNGVSRSLYIDGVASSNVLATAHGVLGSGRDDLYIGWTNGLRNVGLVDDFRVYTYALASDEIAALANVPQPPAQLRMSISRANGGIQLSWPVSAENHRIEFSELLGTGSTWTPLNVPIETANFTYRALQPADANMRFYRLRRL